MKIKDKQEIVEITVDIQREWRTHIGAAWWLLTAAVKVFELCGHKLEWRLLAHSNQLEDLSPKNCPLNDVEVTEP